MGEYNDAFMRNQNSAVQSRTKAQNRANVLQLKLIGQSHPTGLTNSLLKLFEPRPPLEFKPPPEKRKCLSLTGMAQFVSKFAEPTDPEYAPPVPTAETPAERRARIHKLRLEKGAEKAAEELPKYLERDDPNVTGDPYKTLFVARLNYETNESRVKREFESYGPIKRVRLVTDQESGKPRGYAFIEYVHKRDMKAAYKQADGKKIDGRRVLVDVERGRTVPNWRPRRLGGGLGTSRVGGELNQREPGREQVQPGGQSQSEEPRVREDRHVERDREKSNDRGRDKEREQEKSRERSHDKPRDRDHREDRHHRDRDRIRDKDRERDREKERDRGHDRDRARDRGRDRGRDTERDRERERDREHDRNRLRERERERDYESGSLEHERGRSRDRDRDRELEYDRVESKHERDKHREMDYDHGELEDDGGWYENSELGRRHPDPDHDAEQYDQYEKHRGRRQYDDQAQGEHDRYEQYSDRDRDQYDRMEGDYDYKSRDKEKTRDGEDEYRRSERSLSRDY